jgi:hypothetical protein
MDTERPGNKSATGLHLFTLPVGIFLLAIAGACCAKVPESRLATEGNQGKPSSSKLIGGWHLVRTPNPQGGADAVSIMHTADISKSDLDLAGLMVRCRDGGTEAVIVLLRSFPVRAHPHVIFGKPGNAVQVEATVAPPGTIILVPGDAATLVNGPWQALHDLLIQVSDGKSKIRGVVPLAGLQATFKILVASCPMQ